MPRFKQARWLTRGALLLGAAMLVYQTAQAAASLGSVVGAADQWLTKQVDSQKKIDKLADDRQSLADDYRNSLREADSLKLYIEQLRSQLKSQEDEMDGIRGEIREISRTNVEILPLMVDMLATLDRFVQLDVPFEIEERRGRIKALNDMMPRADVTVSEKFRRIVEAYNNEIDYGRTIDTYTGNLKDHSVTFLRVGRVALVYQTPDGKETGYWDRDKKDWVIDNSYGEGVSAAIRVATKQVPPDLLHVPIQAAAGAPGQGS